MNGSARLILVRRDKADSLKTIQDSLDRWPAGTVAMLDRREGDRRVVQQRVEVDQRKHQRRAEPPAAWHTHGFIVVPMDRPPLRVPEGTRSGLIGDLPGWPPSGLPGGRAGVLHSVGWRVDLLGARDLRLEVTYEGALSNALYPGRSEIRERLAGGVLERLHAILSRSVGQPLERIAGIRLS